MQAQGKLQCKNITKEGTAKIKNLHADSIGLPITRLLNAADRTSQIFHKYPQLSAVIDGRGSINN